MRKMKCVLTSGLILAAAALGCMSVSAKDVTELMIGEIQYSVCEDGGWAQAMHTSMLNALDMLGIDPETNLITMEEIAEEDPVLLEATIEELVDEGCDVIFGCSTGYAAVMSEMQEEYPEVVFAQQGNDLYDNIVEMQIRGYEGSFLCGYLAALMNEGSDVLGYCGSMDDCTIRTEINAFALGAKYANPNATLQVVWTDSWYDPDLEAQNAKTLIDNGIKIMGLDASSPAIPQVCEENGVFCFGINIDMYDYAPNAVLTSFIWNYAPIFADIMTKTADGTIDISTNYYEGGECAALAPFNDELVPADVQQKVEEVKALLESGELNVYAGELLDDEGNVLVAEGEVMADEDILAQDFFVENVVGGK